MERYFSVLGSMCVYYSKKYLTKDKLVIQLELLLDGDVLNGYYLFSPEKCVFEQGKAENYDVYVKSHIYDFLDLIGGVIGLDEFIKRNVVLEGADEDIALLEKLFTLEIDPYELGYWSKELEVYDEEWKKPSKVLVINGSGRGKSGITWSFLESFIEGIKDAGVEVEIIHIYDPDIKIEPCHGCFACQAINVAKCVFEDDGTRILEKIKEYDLTVFATPVYLFSFPAKLKSLLDRMFVELQPFFIKSGEWTRHPLWFRKKRYMALFAISGYPEKKIFEPLDTMFEWLVRESHAKLVAKIYRSGAWIYKLVPQFEKYYKLLRKLFREAGKQLVEDGRIDEELVERIEKDYIPKEVYYRVNNVFWYRRYRKMGIDPRKIMEELSS